MKIKLIWLIVCCLLVAVIASASCSQGVATTPSGGTTIAGKTTTPATSTTAAQPTPTTGNLVKDSLGRMVENPQYGGTATLSAASYGVFDPTWQVTSEPTNLSYDVLVGEPYLKGPTGTKEIPLDSTYTPPQYMVGMLAESWESPDPKTCIYHLRQGVHFHNTPPVNGREMTADDVLGTWNLHIVQTRSPHYINPTTPPEQRIKCTKIDKYTVRFDFPNPNVSPWTWVRSAFAIVPPEMYTTYGDLLDWKRECGTGPYTIVDSVTDSSITYKRFSNYWMSDPFFPQNKLPYMDKVVLLIIKDNSTMLAALRTHKIDHVSALTWEQGEDMMKTNPELKYRKILSTTTPVIQFREELAGAPWGNQKVRQALQMATDSNAILSGYLKGNGVILTWPYMPNCVGVYKPLEEQPAQVKALFTYNPDGAKKLLTEAGYPSGIKAKISLFSDPTYTDLMAIVKEQWAKINVTVDFEIMDYGALTTAMVNHTFNDMSLIYWGNIGPTSAPAWAYRSKILYNYSAVNDPYIDEQANAALNTSSLDTQYQILRDLGPYLLERCDYLPLPTPYIYTFWAPWIKQYSGEYIVGKYYNYRTPFIYGWMDQALKAKMTGK